MILVIGGYAQGKLDYVLQETGREKSTVFDGILPTEKQLAKAESLGQKIVVSHFHLWIRDQLLQKKDPEPIIMAFLQKEPDCILISDEIGNGIVPIDAFERQYREKTGRILIEEAKKADKVVRVICGVGQILKES